MRFCLFLVFGHFFIGSTAQSSTVTALIIDDDQNVYLGTTSGLSKQEAGTRQETRMMPGISVAALAWGKKHGVFVACNGNEIRTTDGKLFVAIEEPAGVKIRCMMVSGGTLWVGSDKGIHHVSLSRQEVTEHFTPENSVLRSPVVKTMYSDPSGIKWIGTDRGVIRIEGEKRWKLYEEETSFLAITGNSEGAWIAGDSEMWLVDPFNRWTPTAVKEGLSVGEIRSVATDRKGRVYLLSDIFVQFDPYNDTIIPVDATSVADNVALAIDDNDQLWVASADEQLNVIDVEKSVVATPLLGTLVVRHPTCAGSADGSIEIKPQGGQPPYAFAWDHSEATAEKASGLSGGRYEISITDYAGNLYTDIAQLLEPDLLTARITEDQEAEGLALVAQATGGRGDLRYAWSEGSKARKIAVSAPGTYSVTVTDVNGCTYATSYALHESAFTNTTADAEAPVAEDAPLEAVTVENLKVLEAEALNIGQILRIEQLQFQADSSHIQPESFAVLDGIYDFLRENESIVIEIGGHTNGLPDHAYCDQLSSARAQRVAEYIVSKGIPPNRIAYKGYGKRKPLASNQTVEGRRKNQRVEVKILQM